MGFFKSQGAKSGECGDVQTPVFVPLPKNRIAASTLWQGALP
jgi:hypothetical protein